jgi:hypothetical protein
MVRLCEVSCNWALTSNYAWIKVEDMDANRTTNYELTFVGSAMAAYFPRYRRNHRTLESAQETATQVREKLESRNLPVACHQPIVYGPGCGKDGRTWPW